METKNVAHAVILSKDKKYTYLEKNKRFDLKLTLFGGLCEEGETAEECITREIQEETGLFISRKELIKLIDNDKLVLGYKKFYSTVFLIYIYQNQITTLLNHNDRNTQISTDEKSLKIADFAFDDIPNKIKIALEKN